MKLSYVQKLLLAADPFTAIRKNFPSWKRKLQPKAGTKKAGKVLCNRHLTLKQQTDVSIGLTESIKGPVSMSATASDKEAVCYEGEIADALEASGFTVETNNVKGKAPEHEIPAGVGMTIKEKTVRPVHAFRIVRAFRNAGVAITTRINGHRRRNDTLYIAVGPNVGPALVLPTIESAATWQSKVLTTVLDKWKTRFR